LPPDIHRLFLAALAKQAAGRLDSIATAERQQPGPRSGSHS
jgi:hypothetical protein